MTTGAAFARGQSKQDYSTPREFLDAVKKRWGFKEFYFDLAATYENCVAWDFYGPSGHRVGPIGGPVFTRENCVAADALVQSWQWRGENAWLNPPFDTIRPWAEKCCEWQMLNRFIHQRLFFLVPASVGSEWWAEFVDKHAAVKFLRPRLNFDGKNPYPKDTALAVYGETPGYECWRWK